VSKRTLATPHKVCEEVSHKGTWNQCEPRNVRVSLPRRAEESSEVRSSGNNVLVSASLAAETDEGRSVRLNGSEASSSNLVKRKWPKRLTGQNHNGRWVGLSGRTTGSDMQKPHRGTDANHTGHTLLHRQLGKPSASHTCGIPTVRKGDGAEGMRWWKKRTPPRNRAERAAITGIPNPKGCRLPLGPYGKKLSLSPHLWRC
jgi:hypothetical protein